MQTISDLLRKITGSNTFKTIRQTIDPNYIYDKSTGAEFFPQKVNSVSAQSPQTIDQLKTQVVQQTPELQTQRVSPTPPTNTDSIQKMINVYGGEDAPLHNFSNTLSKAGQYDFWKNNPELLALIPHLETSSGRNVTRPNNLTNWGINYPGNNEAFSQMTQDQVLERFISGVAERDPNYSDFRTGLPLTDEELLKFASKYEPANADYGPNLINGRKHIRGVLGFGS